MTDREKLIELQKTNCKQNKPCVASCLECMADHLIANGVTFHKWVPTALGFFPDEYGRYLCVVRSFAFPGCFYQTILQYDNYGFREGNIYTDDVAYWMPLPEPPKEEKNNG
jgi:hypothetical protein